MASASSSTTTSSRRGRGVMHEEEGREICDCGSREVIWTSWTDRNPGRRFYGCRHYSPPKDRVPKKGCEHFTWFDAEMSMRAKEVINKLKNEKKLLVKENKALKGNLGSSGMDDMYVEIEDMMADLREMKETCDEVRKQLKRAKLGLAISWLFILALLLYSCA